MPGTYTQTNPEMPEWYEQFLRNNLKFNTYLRKRGYQPFRYSPFMENRFFRNPQLQGQYQNFRTDVAQPQLQQSNVHLREAARPFEEMRDRYMNPYLERQEGNLLDASERRFAERMLPYIRHNEIGRGTFHSTGRNEAEHRAMRDLGGEWARQRDALRYASHGQAADINQMERAREAGLAAQQAQLGLQKQGAHYADIGMQGSLGTGLHQARTGTEALRQQEFQRAQQEAPAREAQLTGLAHGIPMVPGQSTTSWTPSPTQPDMMSATAGMLFGAANQPHARGGQMRFPTTKLRKPKIPVGESFQKIRKNPFRF